MLSMRGGGGGGGGGGGLQQGLHLQLATDHAYKHFCWPLFSAETAKNAQNTTQMPKTLPLKTMDMSQKICNN